MKLNLSYTFTTRGGFTITRSTPEEILKEFNDTNKELQAIASDYNRMNPDKERATVDSYLDARNKYFPDGSITLYIDGDYMFYRLRTKAEVINQ